MDDFDRYLKEQMKDSDFKKNGMRMNRAISC